jgi:hypothetical protein
MPTHKRIGPIAQAKVASPDWVGIVNLLAPGDPQPQSSAGIWPGFAGLIAPHLSQLTR